MNAELEVVEANLEESFHQKAVLEMMNDYASDPFGDGRPLNQDVQQRLIDGLRNHPTTIIFLAFVATEPIGIAVCFQGFSTFAAAPLINISDFFVTPAWRSQGLGRRLLEAIERKAWAQNCCKLTLEVQENNLKARRIYQAFGFSQAVYVEAAGGQLALSKKLIGRPGNDAVEG